MSTSIRSIVMLGVILILVIALVLKITNNHKPVVPAPPPVLKHKGKDFDIKLTKIDEDMKAVSVVMRNGVSLSMLHEDGTSEPFTARVWERTDVEVQKIIPDSEREQVIVYESGRQQAQEASSYVSTYKLYFVESGGLREIAKIDTYISSHGLFTSSTMSGYVTPKVEKGLPILEFTYREDGGAERTKIYRWNGRVFVEGK